MCVDRMLHKNVIVELGRLKQQETERGGQLLAEVDLPLNMKGLLGAARSAGVSKKEHVLPFFENVAEEAATSAMQTKHSYETIVRTFCHCLLAHPKIPALRI